MSMNLWAVIEDFDNGETWDDHFYYNGLVLGVYETQQEARKNIVSGISDDDWKKEVFSDDEVLLYAKGSEERSRRYVKPLEVGKFYRDGIYRG